MNYLNSLCIIFKPKKAKMIHKMHKNAHLKFKYLKNASQLRKKKTKYFTYKKRQIQCNNFHVKRLKIFFLKNNTYESFLEKNNT